MHVQYEKHGLNGHYNLRLIFKTLFGFVVIRSICISLSTYPVFVLKLSILQAFTTSLNTRYVFYFYFINIH